MFEAVSEAAMLWKDLPNVGEAGLRPQHVPGAASGLARSYQIVQ